MSGADDAREILRRVVMDYGDACQDPDCACSIGAARRFLSDD